MAVEEHGGRQILHRTCDSGLGTQGMDWKDDETVLGNKEQRQHRHLNNRGEVPRAVMEGEARGSISFFSVLPSSLRACSRYLQDG